MCSRGDQKAESSLRSVLQENMSTTNANYQQETGQPLQWRGDKLFPGDHSSGNEYKPQMSNNSARGFSLDHQSQFSPQYSSGDSSTVTHTQGMSSSFQMDSGALYGNPSNILQGLFGGPDHSTNPQSSSSSNFPYPPANYGTMSSGELMPPASWSTSKVPQFLRGSPPKQQQQQQQPYNHHLHFSNNAPYWNASEAAMKDVRPSFFPSLQPQFPTQTFEEKPKVM